uniref:Uncharacterized protein n=2 Tax=Wuchereria bancrofti TaxID=6293 RepID=A0AAF5PZ20_WUCBA
MSPNKLTTSCSVRNFYRDRWYWQCDREWSGSSSSSSDNNDSNSDSDDNSSISISRTYCSLNLINFRTILIIYCIIIIIINVVTTKDIARQRFGCNLSDHQACDELCKQDSYWYGHCSIWDGHDFTCSCYQYKMPLNGSICKRIQKICNEYCIKRGLEGGYCYVYASRTAPNGTTECKCFEELSKPVRGITYFKRNNN